MARAASITRQLHGICSEDDCGRPVSQEGRCAACYARWRAHWRDVCPWRCNDKWRAADAAWRAAMAVWAGDMATRAAAPQPGPEPPRPQPPESFPWAGQPVLCLRCAASVRRELSEVSDLAAIADAESSGQRRPPEGQRVSGTRHTPSPSPTADDLDELAGMLRSWEGAARRDDTAPRRGYLATEIATLCARLSTACFPALTQDPDVALDFARDIHHWHARLRKATSTGTGRHQKHRPCPRCDRYSLVWEEGADHVACETPSCGRLMSLDEFDQYDQLFPHFQPGEAA